MKSFSCPNRHRPPSKQGDVGAIIRHGFSTTTGTPYYRLQHCRSTFDRVASLSVEGLNKSAIARVNRISWNTVHRWLQRAAACCRRLMIEKLRDSLEWNSKRMRSERSSGVKSSRSGSSL